MSFITFIMSFVLNMKKEYQCNMNQMKIFILVFLNSILEDVKVLNVNF